MAKFGIKSKNGNNFSQHLEKGWSHWKTLVPRMRTAYHTVGKHAKGPLKALAIFSIVSTASSLMSNAEAGEYGAAVKDGIDLVLKPEDADEQHSQKHQANQPSNGQAGRQRSLSRCR